jgi:2-dehydro-3-deoxyphosphogluconate aldolase/(4S)-4-hydroxy-2-oxoglutarate aldolase
VKFIAGKNIAEKKLAEYLGCENVLACSSEWIATSLHIDNDEFDKITELCKKAIFASLELKVKHIGINNDKADDAVKTAEFLGNIFGFATKEGPASVFATNAIELMKSPGPGTKGHIGISAVNVPRAIAYLERMGVEIDTNTFRYDAKGNVNFVYLKEELCGFAIHLVNNIPNIQNI